MNYLEREAVTKKQVRKECKKRVADVVIGLMEKGWTVVRSGHKFRLVCPCRPDPASFRVDGTPRVEDVAAQQVERKGQRCPKEHEHIR